MLRVGARARTRAADQVVRTVLVLAGPAVRMVDSVQGLPGQALQQVRWVTRGAVSPHLSPRRSLRQSVLPGTSQPGRSVPAPPRRRSGSALHDAPATVAGPVPRCAATLHRWFFRVSPRTAAASVAALAGGMEAAAATGAAWW